MPLSTLTRRHVLGSFAAGAGLLAAPAVLRAQDRPLRVLFPSRPWTDQALFEGFTAAAGLPLDIVTESSGAVLTRILEEGAATGADVMLTHDAARLYDAQQAGALQAANSDLLERRIPAQFRDPDGTWFGFSMRARGLWYAPDRLSSDDLAALTSYASLTDPRFAGRVLTRTSTNIHSRAFLGAMLVHLGEDGLRDWTAGVAANLARPPEGGDTDQIRAVAAGVGDIGISNNYYGLRLGRSDDPDDTAVFDAVNMIFPDQDINGTHVNIAGGGITSWAADAGAARAFLEYLSEGEGQRLWADSNDEFPVVEGTPVSEQVAAQPPFRADPTPVAEYAAVSARAVEIAQAAGWA